MNPVSAKQQLALGRADLGRGRGRIRSQYRIREEIKHMEKGVVEPLKESFNNITETSRVFKGLSSEPRDMNSVDGGG